MYGLHALLNFEVIVLKFPSRQSTRILSDLENEASAWKNIYGVKAHVRKINGANVLVMPYVRMFSTSDWDDEELLQAAMEGCEHFAEKGYKHSDLKRRHVGRALIEGKMRAVFTDLASIEKIDSNDEADVAEEMKKKLREAKVKGN